LCIANALIDTPPIDRRIHHLYLTSRPYCSGVSKIDIATASHDGMSDRLLRS
jgi:hypothetical protein